MLSPKQHFKNGRDTTDPHQRIDALLRAHQFVEQAERELDRYHWFRTEPMLRTQVQGLLRALRLAGDQEFHRAMDHRT